MHADHFLVKLFAGADSNDVDFGIGSDRLRQIQHLGAGNLRNKQLAAMHAFERSHDELDTLIERDPEASHARIRDGKVALSSKLLKQGDNAASAADHVAVSHDR